jgi:zinc protease
MRLARFFLCMLAVAPLLAARPAGASASVAGVTRATLANGLQVVVVRDTLAPVVTTMMNYRVGSDEQWIPGLAHATEHMMFRGSKTLSSSQLMEAIGITGGDFDADTEANVTQYYFTVPSQYLDIALRAERSRATGLLMAPDQWAQERGAITQEVKQDDSNAFYRLFVKMQRRLIGGTPYDKNTLGTVRDFATRVDSAELLKFYRTWYHPNNAIFVIAGDVDPEATIARVKQLFGDIPAVALPPRPAVHLEPLKPGVVYHDTSDQPFTAVMLGYRMPGYQSPDYAAGRILADVLNNQRSTYGGLAYTGGALGTEFFEMSYPKVGVGIAFTAVPVTADPAATDREVRALIDRYAKDGIPADLVRAAKLREIAQLEFAANSIEGLAFQWSRALAVQGIKSPDDMIGRFEKVSVADVDRVLRTYLDNSTAVAAYAVPKSAGTASAGAPMAQENNQIPPSRHEPLPWWAQRVLAHLSVPPQTLAPVSSTLPNGIRLIVQPEHATHTVVVSGQILNDPKVQEPSGQEGVARITASLLPFGTTTYDRVAFARQLDDIAAKSTAGTQFGLSVLSRYFDRGVALLADEELHPAFDPKAFAIVKRQTVDSLTGEMTAPAHLAAVALDRALYPPGDPFRRFASPQSAGAITLDDVKRWYAGAYRPDLTTIVVVGDVTPQQAESVFAKYFGAWTASGPKPNVYPSPVPPNAPGAFDVPAAGRIQSSVELAETIGLLRGDSDWAPLQVANAVLTGGFYSSLLYHDLREINGYVYYVSSAIDAGKVRSTFSIRYGCDPKNILAAQSQIATILRRLEHEPIASGRLLRAKALLMGEMPIRIASYDGVAGKLLDAATRGLPLNQNEIDARAELAAAPAAIEAAVRKYIRPDGFVRVVTGPPPP